MAWPDDARYQTFNTKQPIGSAFLNEIQDQIIALNEYNADAKTPIWRPLLPIFNEGDSWAAQIGSGDTVGVGYSNAGDKTFMLACQAYAGEQINKIAVVYHLAAGDSLILTAAVRPQDFESVNLHGDSFFDGFACTGLTQNADHVKVWDETDFQGGVPILIAGNAATIRLYTDENTANDVIYHAAALIVPAY